MGAIQNAVNAALSAGTKAAAAPAAISAIGSAEGALAGIRKGVSSVSDSYEEQERVEPHSIIDFNEMNPHLSKAGAKHLSAFDFDERRRLLRLAQKASVENAITDMEALGGIRIKRGYWLDAYRKTIAEHSAKKPGGNK